MSGIAVFPGSFDPITKGHEALVKRAIPLFEEIIIAIGVNSSKKTMFTLEERKQFIEQTFANNPTVRIDTYQGLTVDYCSKVNAGFILRGLRNGMDFEFEKSIGQMNQAMKPEIETILLITNAELSAINSTIVRDIIRNGGDAHQFLPEAVSILS